MTMPTSSCTTLLLMAKSFQVGPLEMQDAGESLTRQRCLENAPAILVCRTLCSYYWEAVTVASKKICISYVSDVNEGLMNTEGLSSGEQHFSTFSL